MSVCVTAHLGESTFADSRGRTYITRHHVQRRVELPSGEPSWHALCKRQTATPSSPVRHPPLLVLVLTLGACAHTQGARPHDMSVADHQAAAASEDTTAEAHAAQYDPSAAASTVQCRAAGHSSRVCWTKVSNPTAAHQEDAEKHAKMAADHRAASAALRTVEDEACAGIAIEDRDMSPFEHPADIESVTPLVVHRGGGKAGYSTRIEGAVVRLRAVPGLTAEWLQRSIECHLARNASLGHDVPEMPDCPLVPNGAEATVISTGTGFAVTIRSPQEVEAEEILARARRLTAAP